MDDFQSLVSSLKELNSSSSLHGRQATRNLQAFKQKFKKSSKKGIVFPGEKPKANDRPSRVRNYEGRRQDHTFAEAPLRWIPMLLGEIKAGGTKQQKAEKFKIIERIRLLATPGAPVPGISPAERSFFDNETLERFRIKMDQGSVVPEASDVPKSKNKKDQGSVVPEASDVPKTKTKKRKAETAERQTSTEVPGLGTVIEARKTRRTRKRKRMPDYVYYDCMSETENSSPTKAGSELD